MKRLILDPSWPESTRESHHYDELELWDTSSAPGYSYAYENRFSVVMDLVHSAALPPARVIDIAGAQGNFTLALAERGYQVVWNDLRAELADYVRLKYEYGQVDYKAGSIFDLASADLGLFDVVLANEVIEHVAHPDQFLAKLATLLDGNGTIILTTPNGSYFRNKLPRFSDCPDPTIYESIQFKPNADGHIFLLHADELHTLATKAGLCVERILLFTNPVTAGYLKTAPLLRILPKKLISINERLTRALPLSIRRWLSVQLAVSFKRFSARA